MGTQSLKRGKISQKNILNIEKQIWPLKKIFDKNCG